MCEGKNGVYTENFTLPLVSQGRQYLYYDKDIPLDEFRILVDATDKIVRDFNNFSDNST